MPFKGHTQDAYIRALHVYYCQGKSAEDASAETNINPTVIERAATGWTNGADGKLGREAFIRWARGLHAGDAPCCGASIKIGRREPPEADPVAAELKALRARLAELESQKRKKS